LASAPRSNMLLVGLVIAIIVVGVLGYYLGSMTAPVYTTTYTQAAQTVVMTTTKTETVTPVYEPPAKIRAGFIYVGPIGDYGWTFMHDLGRRVVAELYKDWLEFLN